MKRLLGFLVPASIGALYGLFFAQKSGSELRSDLKKSKTPTKDLMNELKNVTCESGKEAKEWAENSEELKKLLDDARAYFDDLVEKSKDLKEGTAEKVGAEFAELSQKAAEAAKKVKETATKNASKFKNEIEKEVKTVAEKVKK